MFGLSPKSPEKKIIYEIVMRSALIIYHLEKTSGSLTHPDIVKMVVDATAKKQKVILDDFEKFRTDSCTMAVISRSDFIDRMYEKYGPESFSKYLFAQDGYAELDTIIGKHFS